jgi:hypothetical protein
MKRIGVPIKFCKYHEGYIYEEAWEPFNKDVDLTQYIGGFNAWNSDVFFK